MTANSSSSYMSPQKDSILIYQCMFILNFLFQAIGDDAIMEKELNQVDVVQQRTRKTTAQL
jgi:hypothetical protein